MLGRRVVTGCQYWSAHAAAASLPPLCHLFARGSCRRSPPMLTSRACPVVRTPQDVVHAQRCDEVCSSWWLHGCRAANMQRCSLATLVPPLHPVLRQVRAVPEKAAGLPVRLQSSGKSAVLGTVRGRAHACCSLFHLVARTGLSSCVASCKCAGCCWASPCSLPIPGSKLRPSGSHEVSSLQGTSVPSCSLCVATRHQKNWWICKGPAVIASSARGDGSRELEHCAIASSRGGPERREGALQRSPRPFW